MLHRLSVPSKRGWPVRLPGWAGVLLPLLLAWAAGAAFEASSTEFKGDGRCQFALHGYTLPTQSELIINQAVQKLIDQHQATFGFNLQPDFRVRMRVYGRFEDFTNAPALRQTTNLQGVYVSATREIVTWRQELPGFLGTTLLHEASHAIMDAHYRRIPLWLMEGTAEYFAYSLYPGLDLNTKVLQRRWALLNLWLREGRLKPLATLFNAREMAWAQMGQEQAYSMSWSVVQFLMSSEANKLMLRRILREWQERPPPPDGSVGQIERHYPGGLKQFEAAWHRWIDPAGAVAAYRGSFEGKGPCQFALRSFTLTSSVEATINQQVEELARKQRVLFGSPGGSEAQLHVRIFGDFGDFSRFTTNWMVSGYDLRPEELAQTEGYYSPISGEIVVFSSSSSRKFIEGVVELANTALLRERFQRIPPWVRFGSHQSFVTGGRAGSGQREALATAWRQAGFPAKGLPELKPYLGEASPPWEKQDRESVNQAMALCWAVFDFLSSSEPNRQVLNDLLRTLQSPAGSGTESAALIGRFYPGGWLHFESDFRRWTAGLERRG
jgi:hypothetical protein